MEYRCKCWSKKNEAGWYSEDCFQKANDRLRWMCYCFLHSPYCCEKTNHDNAECLASFSDSIHKNVNTNLIIFFLFFPLSCMSFKALPLSLQNFSPWNLSSTFITFVIMQKVIWEKIFYKSSTHLFYFWQYSRKLELVTATSMKLSFCKCFKGDFQAVWLLIEFWI